ncbi:hypothetical protein BDV27DRAFT_35794 [Aspergillus caelatus]|uniref:Uncharacterized protein n=1 Tax=Aspergillus caelatus TaxID=61420 RepID=A0A5N7AL70_9EURO|nr:uncharacterized protein BDV27DRAFT_35794 [Aspergillus caelatus]KAE8370664.1 hypothetical protein BDV27DRAFT_35794 [Aspergillus caelatus]
MLRWRLLLTHCCPSRRQPVSRGALLIRAIGRQRTPRSLVSHSGVAQSMPCGDKLKLVRLWMPIPLSVRHSREDSDSSSAHRPVSRLGFPSCVSVRAGLLPFVAEEAYGDADLAVMLEDPRVPLGKALNRKIPRIRRDVLSDDAPVVGQYGFVGSGGKASAKFFLESTPGAILRLGPVDMHVMYRTASGNPLATQPANRRTARNLLPRDSRRDKDDLGSRWLMPLVSQHFSKEAHLIFIRKLA